MGGSKRNTSTRNLFFAFIDGLLIYSSVLIVTAFKSSEDGLGWLGGQYLAGKAMLLVSLIQISFYYFDLYEFGMLRERIKMTMTMMEALGVSIILLAIMYFCFPFLMIDQGVSFLTVVAIFSTTLTWRLFYSSIIRNVIFKERILIIGTGEMARKTAKEIFEHGQDAFEIIGFVDEQRKKAG